MESKFSLFSTEQIKLKRRKKMKTYAKLITFVITITLILSLFGCAPQPTETAAPVEPQPQVTEAPQPTEVPPEPTAVPTEVPPEPTEVPVEEVTIRYANWNLGTEEENNIQRQLITAYTDLHPNVTIEFVDMSAEGGWDAVLTSYAAKGELPDVIMATKTPLYVQNGWLADLTDLVAGGW